MNRNGPTERREAPRVDARLPLQLTETEHRVIVTTESVDLSRGGLACRTSDFVAPLSRVALTLILPPFGTLSRSSRSLRAEGVVVRCEEVIPGSEEGSEREYQLACCFTALEPDAQNLLEAFVAWRLLRSGRFDSDRPARVAVGPPAGHGGAPRGRGGAPRRRPRTGGPEREPRMHSGERSAPRSHGRDGAPRRADGRGRGGPAAAPNARSGRGRDGGYDTPAPRRHGEERGGARAEGRPPRDRGPRDSRRGSGRPSGRGEPRSDARDHRPHGEHRSPTGRRERGVEGGPPRESAPAHTAERAARHEPSSPPPAKENPEVRWGRRPQRRDSGPSRGNARDPRR